MCGVFAKMGAVSRIDKDMPNPRFYSVSGIAVIQPIVMQPTETAYPKARRNIFSGIPEEKASAAYDGSGQLLFDRIDEVLEQDRLAVGSLRDEFCPSRHQWSIVERFSLAAHFGGLATREHHQQSLQTQ